jgi:predicted AAA+ superfamily ATPase
MYQRTLNFDSLIKHRSLFLFGPRQTGKSTLLTERYPKARYFNLLHANTFRELSAAPETIRQRLTVDDKLVIIDEIQKLPSLLDEVHSLIESRKDLRFILTGSSARKLRRGGANLLGGRALICNLHPLTSNEVPFDRLHDRLNRGSLPGILDSPIFQEDLNAYVGTYLQEEIQAEAVVRSVENFSRFLSVAGLCNGEQLNFESVANDAQVPARTVREYYQVSGRHVNRLSPLTLPTNQETQTRSYRQILFFRCRRSEHITRS